MTTTLFVFPQHTTQEEHELRDITEELKQLRRALGIEVKTREDPSKVSDKKMKRVSTDLTISTEEVKKKVQTGAIHVKKSEEKSTFKRIKITVPRMRSADSQGEAGEIVSPTPMSPLGSPPSSSSTSSRMITKSSDESNVVFVRGYDLQKDILENAFKKYGAIEKLIVDDRQKCAYITYTNPDHVEDCIGGMDGNMVNGITLRVSHARKQQPIERPAINININPAPRKREPKKDKTKPQPDDKKKKAKTEKPENAKKKEKKEVEGKEKKETSKKKAKKPKSREEIEDGEISDDDDYDEQASTPGHT